MFGSAAITAYRWLKGLFALAGSFILKDHLDTGDLVADVEVWSVGEECDDDFIVTNLTDESGMPFQKWCRVYYQTSATQGVVVLLVEKGEGDPGRAASAE